MFHLNNPFYHSGLTPARIGFIGRNLTNSPMLNLQWIAIALLRQTVDFVSFPFYSASLFAKATNSTFETTKVSYLRPLVSFRVRQLAIYAAGPLDYCRYSMNCSYRNACYSLDYATNVHQSSRFYS